MFFTFLSVVAVLSQILRSYFERHILGIVYFFLFLRFSVLVVNLKKILYTVVNPASGLLNREKRTKRESLAEHSLPSLPTLLVRGKLNKNHVTHLHA